MSQEPDVLRAALVGYQITEVHGQELQVKNPTQIVDEIVERLSPVVDALIAGAYAICYMQARGRDNRFEKHGARQLYWKGRSDAAQEIRSLTPSAAARALELAVVEAKIDGLKLARTRTLPGHRTLVNFGHLPEAVRAIEWLRMDMEGEIADLERRRDELTKAAKEKSK